MMNICLHPDDYRGDAEHTQIKAERSTFNAQLSTFNDRPEKPGESEQL
jgi:hypothetical protein